MAKSIRQLKGDMYTRFGGKADRNKYLSAIIGHPDGSVYVEDRAGYVWARVGGANGQIIQVYARGMLAAYNLPILIYRLPHRPRDYGIADLDINGWASTGGGESNTGGYTGAGYVQSHAEQHWYTGGDPVLVHLRAWTPLRVYPSTGFTIGVQAGIIPRVGADLQVASQTLDLTSHIPVSGALYTLITVDAAGALSATDGTAVAGILVLTLADIPDTPSGHFRLAAVRLYANQTALRENRSVTDIVDLRWPQERLATSISPADIALTDAHLLVGNALNVAADVALSGDATLANTGALTLATVNASPGSYTYATLTVNAKGLITAASSGTAPTTGTGTAGRITQWATSTTLGDSTLIKSGAGVLTLSAAGTYTLTVPSTGDAALINYSNAGYLETQGALKIPTTASLAVGTIQQNGARLLHTFGTNNLFVGPSAGNYTLTVATAVDNTALGDSVLSGLTSGARNFGAGRLALNKLQSGSNNFALGALSMENALTSTNNIAIGYYSLHDGTATQNNIAIGVSALEKNNVAADGRNVAIGNVSLQANASGVRNTAVGDVSANGMTGSYNTVLGAFAGFTGNSGSRNIFIGYQAGYRQTSLSDLLIIDNQAQAAAADNIDKSIVYGVMSSTPGNQTLNVNALLTARITTATTNAVVEVSRIEARSTGTAAAGFGPMLKFVAESAATDTYRDQAAITSTWGRNSTPDGTHTDAGRTSTLAFQTVDNAGSLADRVSIYGALTRIGDIAGGNYAKFGADGTLTLVGTAKYERHIQIPAKSDGTVANQPTPVDFFTVGGNQYATTGAEYGYCQFEVPDDWDGTNMYFEIDWFPDSGAMSGTDTVEWTVEYRAIAEGELINNGTSVTLTSTDSADYSQYKTKHARVTLAFNDANQPLTIQDHVFVKISRNTGVANDFSGSVTVSGYEVIYTSNGFPTAN